MQDRPSQLVVAEELHLTEPAPAVTLQDLTRHRKLLQEFCSLHVPSLEAFVAHDFPVFKLYTQEPEPHEFRHISSSATCFESIESCPTQFRPDHKKNARDFEALGKNFAEMAIASPLDKWRSDGAAEVYCSCRGLPYVLLKLNHWHPNIDDHLGRIFYQLGKQGETGRFAIGEAAKARSNKERSREKETWYKPNAYHTYWTLRILRILYERFPEYQASRNRPGDQQQAGMRLWARQQLGAQVALHSSRSSVLDTDQLAWALAIVISRPEDYRAKLHEQDFIREALRCLFSTQEKIGTWRHYAPLFHYPRAGNAYCYVFETFAALLLEALEPAATFVRTILKDYARQLFQLFEYATTTQAKNADGELAWSSGHRITPTLESWATASVFEFAQALRRLVGIWTREEALSGLAYKSQPGTIEKARRTLLERADVWSRDDLAGRLWSMFINPISAPSRNDGTGPKSVNAAVATRELDPDRPLIGEEFPRSAILFGPPGTSKTSLVRAIAGAIGWEYIELHPSHFVAEGLPNVQQTADVIFGRLMQLDQAVVLFDEIDELVRERDIEPDQFGRFLTTSMLPRLAELWKARKIMYFVATNHIEYFDRAVTRSERFDAIIFVSPPSFTVKARETLRILEKEHRIKAVFAADVTREAIDAAMPVSECDPTGATASVAERERLKSLPLPDNCVLAKFAMLRWDELNGLALHLRDELTTEDHTITQDVLKKALLKINDSKSRGLGEYCRFESDRRDYERFDASRKAVWIVEEAEGLDVNATDPPTPVYSTNGGGFAVEAPVGSIANVRVLGFAVERAEVQGVAGRIRLRRA